MLPRKFAPLLNGWLLSGMMSLLVSAISTFAAIGPAADFLAVWTRAWLTAWGFAFPAVLVAAPIARRVVALVVDDA